MPPKGIDDAMAADVPITRVPATSREQVGALYGAPPAGGDPPPDPADAGAEAAAVGTRITVHAVENAAEAARRVRTVLRCCGGLFVMNDRLYVARFDEQGGRATGLVPADVDDLGTVVNDHIRFAQGEEADAPAASPPRMPLKHVLKTGPYPGVPIVSRIAAAPTLTPDGRLLASPGYDAPSRVLYVGEAADVPVPADPTVEDARRAASLLLELVIDFPFRTLTDAATWLALLLTAVGRALIDGPTPLFAFTANVRAAGKTRLVYIVYRILTGQSVPVAPVPKEQDELRKQVTAELLDGAPVGLLDNLDVPLRGAVIEALLTSTTFRGRRLGKTEMLVLPNMAVWCATGNGLRVEGDAARRAVWVRLDSSHARPELRTDYRVPNLMALVHRHRQRLLVAAATIIAAYLRADRPSAGARLLGSFEAWGLVQNALMWLGLPDPAGCQAEGREAEEGEDHLRRLVYAVWRLQEPDGVFVRDLLNQVEAARRRRTGDDPQPAATALFEALEMLDVNSARALGRLLGTLVGRQFDIRGYRFTVTQLREVQRAVVWKVIVTDPAGKQLADGELPDALDPPGPDARVSQVSSVSPDEAFQPQLRAWQQCYGLPTGLGHYLGDDSLNSLNSPAHRNVVTTQSDAASESLGAKLTPAAPNSRAAHPSTRAEDLQSPNDGHERTAEVSQGAPLTAGESHPSESGELYAGLNEPDSRESGEPGHPDLVEVPDGCRQVGPGVWEV